VNYRYNDVRNAWSFISIPPIRLHGLVFRCFWYVNWVTVIHPSLLLQSVYRYSVSLFTLFNGDIPTALVM
jgi:hypothetical protein